MNWQKRGARHTLLVYVYTYCYIYSSPLTYTHNSGSGGIVEINFLHEVSMFEKW